MSDFPTYFSPGAESEIGSYTFHTDEVIAFARKFDPQTFHLDEELARTSVFGGLCASGWHSFSVWMKCLRAFTTKLKNDRTIEDEGFTFEFGPSPGFDNLKWTKPVFVGDTITYFNKVASIRRSQSRPAWHIMQVESHATNQHNELVMSFESVVMLRLEKIPQ